MSPARKRLISFVFEYGARFTKKNLDLVTYGKVTARTARAIFFTASDDELRELLTSKVTTALTKALGHLLGFAVAKPGLYDSEAKRMEADLWVTAAEIQVSLFMSEQLKLMMRIREELGWKDALRFAYDHGQPECKSFNL